MKQNVIRETMKLFFYVLLCFFIEEIKKPLKITMLI